MLVRLQNIFVRNIYAHSPLFFRSVVAFICYLTIDFRNVDDYNLFSL